MIKNNFQLSGVYSLTFKSFLFENFENTGETESSSSIVYSSWESSIKIQRRSGFYISNIAIPMALLSLLSFLSFGILEYEANNNNRLSITLTLLLTAVSYKYVIASSLPQISYLTLLDRYIWLCLGFIILVAVENMLGPRYGTKELYMFISIFGLFVIIHLGLGVSVWKWHRGKEAKNKKEFCNEKKSRNESHTEKMKKHYEEENEKRIVAREKLHQLTMNDHFDVAMSRYLV
jgi:hypothetical protein